MVKLITATDLDQWSARRDAQGHLPTLVRRLIMATVVPSSIRVAAAEGVGSPGFDGVVEVVGGAPPYIPPGKSVWELGTGQSPGRKAAADYRKRTNRTRADERASRTFVFVTSRRWDKAEAWARRKADSSDGWAGVAALDAEDLATWLETFPGISGWLASEHLGRQAFGITGLRDWFADWAERTEPAIPPDLLLCGRDNHAADLLRALDGSPREYVVATRSQDEAVAFVAAVLLASEVTSSQSESPNGTSTDEAPTASALHDKPAGHDAAHREALLERAVVVQDAAAWRRWSTHEHALTLIPLFDDPPIGPTLRGGHHVVLPRMARPGSPSLPSLHRGLARDVWEQAGVPFWQADELARAARRSLTSLRRRIGRTGRLREPAWAAGISANLLAPVLLAGSWSDDVEGDRQVVTALAERAAWRTVARDLAPLTSGDDAPLVERNHLWEFVDIIDAWDALSSALTSEDLSVFHQHVVAVLADSRHDGPDVMLGRQARFSGALRRGMANTLAVLGAVASERTLPGGRTGEEHAAQAVRALLDDAPSERWVAVADVLPVLAEAAPPVFLDALEESLRHDDAEVMALFDEHDYSSRHTSLLWALEALAFSPQHVARVAVVLGQLAERDPGGRLANRPAASLQSILHLAFPQSAVDHTTRLQIVDAVRRSAPNAAWDLLVSLVETLNSGMVVRQGPRFRDWTRERARPTYGEIAETLTLLAERIAADASSDRWPSAVEVLETVPPKGLDHLLRGLDRAWTDLPAEVQRAIAADLSQRIGRHERFRGAAWALQDESLQRLQTFIDKHTSSGLQPADSELFTWWPAHLDLESEETRATLAETRRDAVRRALTGGLCEVVSLAEQCEAPEILGATLAEVTDELDDQVLDLLSGGPAAHRQVAHALARARIHADRASLERMIQARPNNVVDLLLASDIDRPLLDVLDGVSADMRSVFWRRVPPWGVVGDVVEEVCIQLLAHDRPFSVMCILARQKERLPVELTVDALRMGIRGTEEQLDIMASPTYTIAKLLDRLEEAGIGLHILAEIEWGYSPLLYNSRAPKALHRRLAGDAGFFAELVTLVYKRDPSHVSTTEGSDGGDEASVSDPARVERAKAAWHVLQDWRVPLPGSRDGSQPDAGQVRAWASEARKFLEDAGRGQIASLVIGEALSGPATDADGTWPSRAVRDALEYEQDNAVERGVVLGRFNQRGVTVRGPYEGGNQERALAAEYRAWSNRVRAQWPRAGAILDELADVYEADARREDQSADLQAER